MKRICLLFVFLCSFSVTFGQGTTTGSTLDSKLPKYYPKSPNAASLGQFGDYSVNLSTGIPDISIPISEAISGSLKVPITLQYHSGGFRVNQQASWVGLGWTLNTSGQISRTVQDKNDEDGYIFQTGVRVVKQYRDNCNPDDHEYFYYNQIGTVDNEPDIFSYITPTKSGKFIFTQDGQDKILIPYEPIKINHSFSGTQAKRFNKFELLDESGVQYVFGLDKNNNSVIESSSSTTGSYSFSNVNWYLTGIKSPNSDDKIDFTYQDGGTVENQAFSYRLTVVDNVQSNGGSAPYQESSNFYPNTISNGSITSSFNINKIEFENGEIEFIQSDATSEPRKDLIKQRFLKLIKVKNLINGAMETTMEVSFDYSYFNRYASTDAVALKLDKVTMTDKRNNQTKIYTFDYQTDTFHWLDNNAQDYWGYNNGHLENINLIPKQTIGFSGVGGNGGYTRDIGGANREAVPTYMDERILKRIHFPTGGYTDFEFETNRYSDYNGASTYAGGLRVKTIKSYADASSLPITKKYAYGENGTNDVPDGKGVIHILPDYSNYMYEQSLITSNPFSGTGSARSRTFFSNNLLNLDAFDTTPVYYTKVTEYFENEDGSIKNGKNVYNFSYVSDRLSREDYYGLYQKTSLYWQRGLLLDKTTYDNTNNIVHKLINDYGDYKSATYLAGASAFKKEVYNGSFPESEKCLSNSQWSEGEFSYGSYDVETGSRKVNLVTNIYYPNEVTKTTAYTYNDRLQINQTKENTSNGSILYTNLKYPSDYTGDAILSEMTNRNMISTVIETQKLRNSLSIYKVKNTYKSVFGVNAQNLSNNIVLGYIEEAASGGALEKRLSFLNYDANSGNLIDLKIEDGASVKGLASTTLWAYNKTLPIAEIKNANYAETQSALGQIVFNGQNMSIDLVGAMTNSYDIIDVMNQLRTKFINVWVNSYTYEPLLGVTSITAPNSLSTYYTYDGFARLKLTKDHDSNLLDKYGYFYFPTGSQKNVIAHSHFRIATTNQADATDAQKAMTEGQYFDGLGRPLETVGSINNLQT